MISLKEQARMFEERLKAGQPVHCVGCNTDVVRLGSSVVYVHEEKYLVFCIPCASELIR